MPGLQEVIYKLEEGGGIRLLRTIAIVLLALVLAIWYDARRYHDFASPEAMEAGQLARNLAHGKGFTTQCLRPLTLNLVRQKIGLKAGVADAPQPDLVNPPVYPLLLAGLMKVLPIHFVVQKGWAPYPPEVWIDLLNELLFFGTVLLTWRLARKLFDETVADLTTLVLLGANFLWRFSLSGLSTMLLLLLFVGLVWCLVRLEEEARNDQRGNGWFVRWGLLTGGVMGLGTLTRYSFGWLLVPVVLFTIAFLGRRRWVVTGIILLVSAAMVTPWLARNYHWSGTLFGVPGYALQEGTSVFPGATIERSFSPPLSKVVFADYLSKVIRNLRELFGHELPLLGGGSLVAAFFLPSLMMRFQKQSLNRLRLFILGVLCVLVVVEAAGRTHLSTDTPIFNSENLLVLLVPLIFAYGVGLFQIILGQLDLPIPELRRLVTVGFVGLACAPLILTLLPPRTSPLSYPPYYGPWEAEVAGFLKPNELMMSDIPWAIAWYGNRECVWTPTDVKGFYTIFDQQKAVSLLQLTALTLDKPLLSGILETGSDDWGKFVWQVLAQREVPNGFPLTVLWARHLPAEIVLADRKRWLESDVTNR